MLLHRRADATHRRRLIEQALQVDELLQALTLRSARLEFGRPVCPLVEQPGSARGGRKSPPGACDLIVVKLAGEALAALKHLEEPRRGGRLPGDRGSVVLIGGTRELGKPAELTTKLGQCELKAGEGVAASLRPSARSGQPSR